MAEKTFKGIVLLNKKQYNEYYESNPVLKNGCPVICVITPEAGVEAESKLMMKVGDGTTAFRSLPWLSGLSADVYDWALQETKPTYTASEITFNDGENFQQKYDSGELTGPQGEQGPQGIQGPPGEPGDPGNAVLYDAQTLTSAQQQQARVNISALAAAEKGAAGGVATLNGSGTITGVQSCSPVVSVSDGDTIGIQQIGQTLRASPTSGETFTLTIQAGVFSVNDEFTVLLSGPGTVIVQGQENVQIRGANFSGAVEISTRYASVSFKKFVENANGEYFSVAGPGIGVATLDENGRLQGEQACSSVVKHNNTTNYTMSTDDVGKAHLFLMPTGSSATMTVTLPASLPVGTEFEMLKGNSGTTLVVSAGAGATISTINKSGQSSVRAGSGKFALITLKRYNQNWWFATGADE